MILAMTWHEQNQGNKLNIYSIKDKILIKSIDLCNNDEIVSYWDIYDDTLIIMCYKYTNPYGQIYKENKDDECNNRCLKIKAINIQSLLK